MAGLAGLVSAFGSAFKVAGQVTGILGKGASEAENVASDVAQGEQAVQSGVQGVEQAGSLPKDLSDEELTGLQGSKIPGEEPEAGPDPDVGKGLENVVKPDVTGKMSTSEKVLAGLNVGAGIGQLGLGLYNVIAPAVNPPHQPGPQYLSSHASGAMSRQTDVNAAGFSANGGGPAGAGGIQYAT